MWEGGRVRVVGGRVGGEVFCLTCSAHLQRLHPSLIYGINSLDGLELSKERMDQLLSVVERSQFVVSIV
jgi:hypothetical protein